MALLEYEQDKELGSRVELYLFESDDGRYRWAYTTDAREKVLGPVVYKPEAIKRGLLPSAQPATVPEPIPAGECPF